MKKLLCLIALIAISSNVNAQIETPAPSPFSKIEQKVGLTDVTLEYSRPSMKGRTVFGDLVPYDKLWRLGANMNTKITFSDDVTVGSSTLKAGSYAVYATPGQNTWDVVFYTDFNNGGLPQNWDDAKVAAKVTVPVSVLPFEIETFTMSFDNLTNSSAVMGMFWSSVYVGVEIKVPSDAKVSAAIEKTMKGPSAGDYFAAAVYYAEEGKDINQAKTWMDKAISMMETPRFWHLRQQSLIYAKVGDKKAAIEAAKKSLAGAKEAGNNDYIKMNTDSLKEWGAM